MKKLFCGFLFVLQFVGSGNAFAQDIELYVGSHIQRSGERPQVLIIFDTSGSMTTEETIRSDYDPDTDYGENEYVYYSNNSSVPNVNSNQKFLKIYNGCASSFDVLAQNGVYNGKLKLFRNGWTKNNGSWVPNAWKNFWNGVEINASKFVDCLDDVNLNNPRNAVGVVNGLPSNDSLNVESPPPYAALPSTFPSFDKSVTLYSSNYIKWYNNVATTITKTRTQIAKDTVVNLIESAPSVVFGLEVFNYDDGGRITYGIKSEKNYVSGDLVSMIKNDVGADGFTPLCESLYEAAMYFGGKNIVYGNSGGSRSPAKDPTISSNGKYHSPFAGCSNEVYVILITDGVPVRDTGADSKVDALISGGSGNRLDDLAKWMHNNDINDNVEGDQRATIFTIGFGQQAVDNAGVLLNQTAINGGGRYYPASNPGDLLNSLQSALLEILEVSTSFTSPSIASNNFDRTETLDSVYYAMFLPGRGPRWSGNLKKLKISGDEQLDRNNNVAINSFGNISDNAKTFWSTSNEADGPEVGKGGVAEMLRTKTSRNLYSNTGNNGALEAFTYANAVSSFSTAEQLATYMGVGANSLESEFQWAAGIDVNDEDDDGEFDDIRHDVFGDPLHSKPLVINYGGSADNQDVRIVLATNAGFIHMFQDKGSTVDETWAFMPSEFFGNIPKLRVNSTSTDKVYGIDGSPTLHVIDKNGDGSVNKADGDTAWLFFGLRRGGKAYYAVDITSPDTPKMMWRIDNNTAGFSELGQTWAKIKIGYSKLNYSDSKPQPVAFISGGYDTNKDQNGVGSADSSGKAIYLVDAKTGTLKWSFSKAPASAINTHWSEIEDSIPASLAIMDSDSDGLVDRIYSGDTGGNVWRIDMPGDEPKSTTRPWTIHKLAELGGSTNIDDRRFFNEPAVVRTIITDTVSTSTDDGTGNISTSVSRFDRHYDAVLLGSGDRTSPIATDTKDKFFMIKDPNVITKSFGIGDVNIPPVIKPNNLYDFTDNPYGNNLSTQDKETLDINVSAKSGWFVDYQASGEKSVSKAIAIAGVAYFNSFTPTTSSTLNQCSLNAGVGKLFAVDLAKGSNVYNWRSLDVGDRVPDTPTIVIPPEDPEEDTNGDGLINDDDKSNRPRIRLLTGVTLTACEADDCDPDDPDKGVSLETMRTHLYIEESH